MAGHLVPAAGRRAVPGGRVLARPRPVGRGPRRLAVGVSRAQLLFWLARGVAVVAPVRPGYGASGRRATSRTAASHFDDAGRCIGHADFRKTADAAVRSVDATLRWLRRQPWADASDVLLVGQSVGGLATVAAGAHAPPGVVGYVNFAGGTGGNPERSPGPSCEPGQLEALYAGYGRATTVPNLWIYAINDQFWGAGRAARLARRVRARRQPQHLRAGRAGAGRRRPRPVAASARVVGARGRCVPRAVSASPGTRRRRCVRCCGWTPAEASRIFTTSRSLI